MNDHQGQAVGVLDPAEPLYTGTDAPVLPGSAEGAQTCYLNLAAGFTNSLTYSGRSLGRFVKGQTYTLTVALGGRRDNGMPATEMSITLLANGKPAGPGAVASPVADRFFDLSYSFTATAAQAGQAIGIQIFAKSAGADFQQAHFDNVRLSTARAPARPARMAVADKNDPVKWPPAARSNGCIGSMARAATSPCRRKTASFAA